MTRRLTSQRDRGVVPIRVVILTLDHHIASAVRRAEASLADELPGLVLSLHAATSFDDPAALSACLADIARGDILVANMLFMDNHVRAVLPALEARRDDCDALVGAMSAGEVIRLTKMGRLSMDGEAKGPLALLKKLRGAKKKGASKDGGAGQMAMLRRLPKLLRFIPGKAQDLRAYFLVLSYWLSGSSENIADMVRLLVSRYAAGPRASLEGTLTAHPPRLYPEVGLYHPALPDKLTDTLDDLPSGAAPDGGRGRVGLILMRSYLLSGDTEHYDRVIAELEARGLTPVPVFASGLDARPAVERFFIVDGRPTVDAVVSLTGFSLVGGPAFNDASAAEEILSRLDVPYLTAQPLEFQSIEGWRASSTGLTPIEATIMVAIPELDGATGPMVFGGRPTGGGPEAGRHASGGMVGIGDRIAMLVARVERLVALRATPRHERNVAVVLFNFPPNGGAVGTAAYLSVFESLHRTLVALAAEGYDVDVPASVEELRAQIVDGNAAHHGTDANVVATIPSADHVRREPHLDAIEREWGRAPGKHLTDGHSLFVLGARFGRVLVGLQPGFGYEGDPMRLLHAEGLAPTHAFSAFYRYLREDFAAHAVVHFGTHGALEFMPGKQVGLSADCWPERLIGDVPNLYLYAANNPSEGALARRRAAATLISYLTPPVTRAGLYKGLAALRDSLAEHRRLVDDEPRRARLVPVIQAQAAELDLADAEPAWPAADDARIEALRRRLTELEETMIPCGLHVFGEPMPPEARADYLAAVASVAPALGAASAPDLVSSILEGASTRRALRSAGLPRSEATEGLVDDLRQLHRHLSESQEMAALVHALDGGFVRPAPGGDLLRNPSVLPTGRNLHGFDPFAIPSAFALEDGAAQAARLLDRHTVDGSPLPRSVALVLWGSDNLKSGGVPIGQALALLGARPRFDSYGRLCGAELVPLAELGRPRIDVLVTLSGIFRDLLPLQTRLLAEAAWLCASADEPVELNHVRAHALAYQREHGGDLRTAALRIFSNAEGAYGANVNQLVDSGAWEDEDELADSYTRRKCFAYGPDGTPVQQSALLESLLSDVDLAYQNVESVELGVTTIDHYFDTLGGIGRAARRARGDGATLPVYISDQTTSQPKVRTLGEQVALESRTRALNPKWAEAMLEHGAEGVRQIEAHVTNTLGWSATTEQVEPWVYRELTRSYVLDEQMRDRLAALNPRASAKLAGRLIEAVERDYWQPDEETRAALELAGDELEDRLEGLEPQPGTARVA